MRNFCLCYKKIARIDVLIVIILCGIFRYFFNKKKKFFFDLNIKDGA